MNSDRDRLKALANSYLEMSQTPQNNEKRLAWQDLNSMRSTRPLIHIRGGRAFSEIPGINEPSCTHPVLADMEKWFKLQLFRLSLGDDTVFEPWAPCRAVFDCTGWGMKAEMFHSDQENGAWNCTHPLIDLEDLNLLRAPRHSINEKATDEKYNVLQEAIGDVIEIDLDRSPAYRSFGGGDISTDLGYLRGIQEVMVDMYDQPDELHALLAFMRDGILRVHEEAERNGDWGLSAHDNQSMPYCHELELPQPNQRGRKREELSLFIAAQEFTLVSPQMHDEFMLQYQLPIIKKFASCAYGCCEDLTKKIDILRQIPNLRRIAIAPLAKIECCSEQIGTDYVMSYRPNPAEMVCMGFDESRIRKMIRHAAEVFSGQYYEINLKDVDTCQNDVGRLARWVAVVRDEIER